jgi:hypothetical protein
MSYRAAVALTAALVAGVAVSGCRFEVNIGERTASVDANVPDPVKAINLVGESGDIRVRTGSGNGVQIRRVVRYHSKAVPHLGQQLSGDGVLTFTKDCSDCSIEYDLTAPSSVRLQIRNGSGSVAASNVSAADLETGSGDILVRSVDGPVRAHTGSGSVTVESAGTQTDLHATSGDIRGIGLLGGKVQADTGSGSVLLRLSAQPSSVRAVTQSGDLRVQLPDGPYQVDAETGSGDREISVPTNGSPVASVYARTGSGSLSIEPAG